MSAFENSNEYVAKLMFKEITSTTPISREEEHVLLMEAKTANPARRSKIRNVIINANLRFALKACLNYKNVPNVSIADMMSEAKIGLLAAFEKYDPEMGIKFISFAVWQIRHRFSKYFDGIDMIRIPTHRKTELNKARKEGDVADFDEYIAFLHAMTQTPLSIDMPAGDDGECTLADVLVDTQTKNFEKEVYRDNIKAVVNEALDDNLTEEEKAVIKSLFGYGYSDCGLKETAVAIGKSHERVRQLRDNAMIKLRKDQTLKIARETFRGVDEHYEVKFK